MRIPHDLMKSVVFIGDRGEKGFVAKGTGFLLEDKGFVYLVTAKHVAVAQETLFIHFNKRDGTTESIHIDPEQAGDLVLRWFHHPTVDISVMLIHLDFTAMGIDTVAIRSGATVPRKFPRTDVGCGDICHAVGLYSRHTGKKRLMPACHTGHVAMMADSAEPIPVQNRVTGEEVEVVGYLAELSNLPGLSGGPVFVREGLELNTGTETEPLIVTVSTPNFKLLGVWQGSWADPDNWESDVSQRTRTYVQLRMGIVVPAEYLVDLLESNEVQDYRDEWFRRLNAASTD